MREPEAKILDVEKLKEAIRLTAGQADFVALFADQLAMSFDEAFGAIVGDAVDHWIRNDCGTIVYG